MSVTSLDQEGKEGQGKRVLVQNGLIHQKDAVNDDDSEPHLSCQPNQNLNQNLKPRAIWELGELI
uniref:Uncharacterized protein n=1 Tax=Sarcophilus harrisii TaxID=9305 RepID=A0A7N4UXC0_SARHA